MCYLPASRTLFSLSLSSRSSPLSSLPTPPSSLFSHSHCADSSPRQVSVTASWERSPTIIHSGQCFGKEALLTIRRTHTVAFLSSPRYLPLPSHPSFPIFQLCSVDPLVPPFPSISAFPFALSLLLSRPLPLAASPPLCLVRPLPSTFLATAS